VVAQFLVAIRESRALGEPGMSAAPKTKSFSKAPVKLKKCIGIRTAYKIRP
jgi:hypothetical protein